MSYGTPLAITLPTIDGVATEAQAAPLINACFNSIKARLEQKIVPASMDVNADLSFRSGSTYSGATDLRRAAFTSLAAALSAASFPSSCYVVNGDLYFNDASGNQIQVTASGAVNVSASGGVTGTGYGASGVEVNWDAANSRYRMRSGTGANDFAAVMSDDILLVDDSANAIRLGSPSAISADYTILLPSALPAGTSLVELTAGGQLQTTTAPTLTGLTSSGTVTLSSATIVRGQRRKFFPAIGAVSVDGQCTYDTADDCFEPSSANRVLRIPLVFEADAVLHSINVYYSSDNGGTKTMNIQRGRNSTLSGVDVVTADTWTTDTNGDVAVRSWNFADITVQAGAVASGAMNSVSLLCFNYGFSDSSTTGEQFYGIEVIYTPAW